MLLCARSLVKQYKAASSPALNNFNLRVQQGEFFGLLGPNGAGKTTAISILSGLFPADSGTVLIMGTELRRNSNKIQHISGLVPQDIALYDKLTARENLVFFGKLYGLHGNSLQNRIVQCLERTALTEHAANPVFTYSGGMKRRLNLAAGLLNDPKFSFSMNRLWVLMPSQGT